MNFGEQTDPFFTRAHERQDQPVKMVNANKIVFNANKDLAKAAKNLRMPMSAQVSRSNSKEDLEQLDEISGEVVRRKKRFVRKPVKQKEEVVADMESQGKVQYIKPA